MALGQSSTIGATAPASSKPTNQASFDIQGDPVSSAGGISVTLEGQNIEAISATVEIETKTVTFLPIVSGVQVTDIPASIRGNSMSDATIKFPIVVSGDPNAQYRLTIWAKSSIADEMDWGDPKSKLFKGFTRATPQTFKLEFNADALRVSVETSDIETLQAQWQVGKNTVGTQENTGVSPNVSLKYATLGATGSELPSMILTLGNSKTHEITQEARVTLAVAADQSLKGKIKDAKTPQKQGKASFSWQDLAKSGVGALLTYFAGAL